MRSKTVLILPPGANQRPASSWARRGSRWNSPTRTAKIVSKRRSPRSSVLELGDQELRVGEALLRFAAAAIIFGERSIAVSFAPRSHT